MLTPDPKLTFEVLLLKVRTGSRAAVQRLPTQCRLVAHSRTNGARTADPERTFEALPLKVWMGSKAVVERLSAQGRLMARSGDSEPPATLPKVVP